MKTGAIGCLRGDFGTSGGQFCSTWFDKVPLRKTQPFKDELNQVINALRDDPEYHYILAGRSQMADYCHSQPESAINGNYTTEYAFRVSTDEFAYLLRLNLSKDDYNFHVNCYRKHLLDRHLEAASRGIRFITSHYKEKFRIEDGDRIRMIRPEGDYIDRVVRYIDDFHIEVGYGAYANLYHICEFAERMEGNGYKVIPLRSSLPDQCFSTLRSTGEIVVVKKGESGYYPVGLPNHGLERNREKVDQLNSLEGITPAQEAAMTAGSMFGWDVPAGDPKNYNEKGQMIVADRNDRRYAR